MSKKTQHQQQDEVKKEELKTLIKEIFKLIDDYKVGESVQVLQVCLKEINNSAKNQIISKKIKEINAQESITEKKS